MDERVLLDFDLNLAKLDDGLNESPTVMVIETKKTKETNNGKNRGILKPSWAFVETKNAHRPRVSC